VEHKRVHEESYIAFDFGFHILITSCVTYGSPSDKWFKHYTKIKAACEDGKFFLGIQPFSAAADP